MTKLKELMPLASWCNDVIIEFEDPEVPELMVSRRMTGHTFQQDKAFQKLYGDREVLVVNAMGRNLLEIVIQNKDEEDY